MADQAGKETESAEKAYAVAAEAAPAKPISAVAVHEKTVAKPAPKSRAPKAKPAVAALQKPLPKKSLPPKPVTQLKEPTMAKTPDFTKSMTDAVSEMQTRAKAAYEKSTEVAGEVSEFTKGNVEALVESGKILSDGFQNLGKTYVEEAKSAFETITADLKEIASIKSPTELFQLQSKLVRRNFDSLVAFSSKNSETMIKLSNEAMAPISSRMSLAADKVSKASL